MYKVCEAEVTENSEEKGLIPVIPYAAMIEYLPQPR